jgi:hypothetical protein
MSIVTRSGVSAVLLDRFEAVLGLADDLVAVLAQNTLDHHSHDDRVVDDQDSLCAHLRYVLLKPSRGFAVRLAAC